MSQLYKKIKADPSGFFFHAFDTAKLKINCFFATGCMKIVLYLRGIAIGKQCDFYGIAYFQRLYNSSISIGNSCRFRSSFLSNKVGLNRPCFISTLKRGAKIEIGNRVGLSGTVIGCAEHIVIGNNVLLGGNTFITDTDWHPLNRDGNTVAATKPVIIEDDAFIGMNTLILKGSRIGKGSVIGANSVVSGEIPPGVIAAGNPCKVIKML